MSDRHRERKKSGDVTGKPGGATTFILTPIIPGSDTHTHSTPAMALPKTRPSPPQNSTRDLKHRVITCLNKLSDRDTHAIAVTELESISRNLTHDSFSPFLTCIYDTDSSEKSPVRKQCVRLLGLLSETHGNALSLFLPKMLANIVRRLRDPDSAVRSACIDAVTAMASKITRPPFSVFLKPLMEAILLEQIYNSQIGLALCLASAIEASNDPEPAQLQRLLPRLVKLLRSNSFKAKSALLSLIGSIIGAGGVSSSSNLLSNLIPCMVEFLSSEDWAARKAAAEVFARLAVVERDMLSEFKPSCLMSFESRRFDKVKVVRDTMNRMVEAWKEVPGVSDEVSPLSQPKYSSRENNRDGRFPPGPKSSTIVDFETPQTRKKTIPRSRSPMHDSSSATAVSKRSSMKGSDRKLSSGLFHKLDCKKPSDWNIKISGPQDDLKGRDERTLESGENESNRRLRPETKRVLFNKNSDDKTHKFGGLRSGSRVVPFHDKDSSEFTSVVSNATEDLYGNHKKSEDLSLIRNQLVQIENQQSSLLDLLQRFIGSSQNGMHSLETRVHGLEMALDDISYDLAIATRRVSNVNSIGNRCFKFPGAGFLSSKFWRRPEGQYSTSRFPSSGGTPSLAAMRNIADKDVKAETFRLESQRFRLQGGGIIVNPLAEIHRDSRGSSEVYLNRASRNVYNAMERQVHNGSGLGVASPVDWCRPSRGETSSQW
ncbi:hypothetical protein HHK36_015228 [Tetracentron sinense]|uniref:TORTIFOLIA1/SINE1-2 N-terminal domain-containing protein n=1 Tax=Tetracentron sinense TaxID=13715 RepID=A0A835DCK5_TETSI|nr:hypothetical protein HHK36_015228 [Tetracentron sinense]